MTAKRQISVERTLKSYFFWTHRRGSFHYDVMVTLILLFIFITPMPFMRRFIDYGDKAATNSALVAPIKVEAAGEGQYGLVLTVPVQDLPANLTSDERAVRKALHGVIQPVTGDAVSVVRWEAAYDGAGKPVAWKVWVHR